MTADFPRHGVVIGAGGAIGRALCHGLHQAYPGMTLHAFSRRGDAPQAEGDGNGGEDGRIIAAALDYGDEESIAAAAAMASRTGPPDLVIVATGMLHDDAIAPEKSLRQISVAGFEKLFYVNTILPALVIRHFLPVMPRTGRCVFAALSARVGSISDNRLGGWYAYRASKAALNMVIRNAAIETARRNGQAVVVGLHPGTVDSALSRPFQGHVPEGKLFTPAFSARNLLSVLHGLTPEDSGKCFAWDGTEIPP